MNEKKEISKQKYINVVRHQNNPPVALKPSYHLRLLRKSKAIPDAATNAKDMLGAVTIQR